MEVLQGMEYSIIKMPKNVSAETIGGLIEEFSRTTLADKGQTEFLLDMQEIPQLHRAGLQFITTLGAAMKRSGRSLSIAGLQDAVENALRFNHVENMAPLFKTIIDFERQKEIVFDFGEPAASEADPEPSSFGCKRNHVLILEQSIACRNNQKLVLGKLPVENIIEAKDPPEAVKRMRSISVTLDLIVADFVPVKPILEEFVRSVRTTPFCQEASIVLTVADDISPDVIEDALAKGISGIITKNYRADDIQKFLK